MNEQEARQELGIRTEDSFKEIRKRYLESVKKYHPDKNPNDSESFERCKRVIEAYTFLCDIKKQAKTQKELEMEQHIWDLFREFWPIPQEFPSLNLGTIKKDISLRLNYRPSYPEFVKERGFYDFISP